jgi:hypothetical protein
VHHHLGSKDGLFLASASPEWLVAAVGPTVQRHLTGDVVLPGATGPS